MQGNKLFVEKQKSHHGSSGKRRNVQSSEFILNYFFFLKLQLVNNSFNRLKKYQAASELPCCVAHFMMFLTISFMAVSWQSSLHFRSMPKTPGTNKTYKSLWTWGLRNNLRYLELEFVCEAISIQKTIVTAGSHSLLIYSLLPKPGSR